MNFAPLSGIIGSAAGAPLAQTKGSEVERQQQEAVRHDRQLQGTQRAEAADGIGTTSTDDQRAADRDADGRRPWEVPPPPKAADSSSEPPRQSKDATGEAGTQLDLSI